MTTGLRSLLAVVAVVAAVGVPSRAAGGQLIPLPGQGSAQAAPGDTAAAQVPAAPPGAFEVVTRYRAVTDSAARAQRAIDGLADVGALQRDVRAAVRRQEELQALFATFAEAEHIAAERVSRVRDLAVLEADRLNALLERADGRRARLGELRSAWLNEQRFWQTWRQALVDDPEFALVDPDMQRALASIDTVLQRVAEVVPAVLAQQRAIEELRAETDRVAAAAEAVRAARREALLLRGEPVLLSPAHRAQLSAEAWREWRPLDMIRPQAYLAFFRANGGALALYALLAVAIALAATRLQRAAGQQGVWAGLLGYPWTIGVFIATVLALQQVALAPPLWDVVLWALFAVTAARLARPLFTARAIRRTLYLLAGFYPVLLLFEAARVPTPAFRLLVVALAAAALPVFAFVARRGTTGVTWPLRIGAGMWAVVLAAEVLGYSMLGRWVLHATITSAAVVFTVVFLVTLAQGAIAALLRVPRAGRFQFLRTMGVPLAQRLVKLLQLVLVVVALLVLLDVWELAGSPVTTWRAFVDAGFTLGPVTVTVGRLLVVALIIYITVLVSWLLRTAVQSEVYRRWELDRGVGESINVLVHYTLITLGAFVALSAIGVELQNFAILAGALGIGIGFGLQNVVNNFVSGLILLFERPVRVGDTVVVGGEWGTIRKIGLRSTIMLTFDQSEMIVPNADLVSEKVTNWTLSNPVARMIMPVGVAYGSSISRVLEILREAGRSHESVLDDPPPMAIFIGFGDSSLDFELRVWVREIRLRLEVRSVVLTEVERRLTAEGIEIPFPQRDLHVRSIDPAAAATLGAQRGSIEPDAAATLASPRGS